MAAILSDNPKKNHFKPLQCFHFYFDVPFPKSHFKKCFVLFYMQREVMAEDEVKFVNVS